MRLLVQILVSSKNLSEIPVLINNLLARIHSGISHNYGIGPGEIGQNWAKKHIIIINDSIIAMLFVINNISKNFHLAPDAVF